MKKNELREKPRRLTLKRETIQVLNDPALLGVPRGGILAGGTTWWPDCGHHTQVLLPAGIGGTV